MHKQRGPAQLSRFPAQSFYIFPSFLNLKTRKKTENAST
jgi:hypothetical protein